MATNAMLSETAAEMAPLIEKAMHRSLKPHRDMGKAEATATAIASGSTITLTNTRYGKFIKGYIFGRRFPKDWVIRLKKRLAGNVRAEMRRAK
ncbi:MAG: hypothetical protein IPM54_25025 [Polyangiaceae bacterium]|nr:hypothetical protein [Polyangiaceae bacterium]